MAKQSKVSVVFNRRAFEFTRQTLEAEYKRASKVNAPVDATHALHMIYLPNVKAPVTTNWFGTYILKTPPQTISLKSGMVRGAYNPGQVLRVASQLADLGVKIVSHGRSATYAPWSAEGMQALQTQIENVKRLNDMIDAPKPTQAHKPKRMAAPKPKTRKPKPTQDTPKVEADAPKVETQA